MLLSLTRPLALSLLNKSTLIRNHRNLYSLFIPYKHSRIIIIHPMPNSNSSHPSIPSIKTKQISQCHQHRPNQHLSTNNLCRNLHLYKFSNLTYNHHLQYLQYNKDFP